MKHMHPLGIRAIVGLAGLVFFSHAIARPSLSDLQAQIDDLQTQINNIQLTPGPEGPPGSLSSLEDLRSLPCEFNGMQGTTTLSFGTDGTVLLKCVTGGTTEGPASICDDGIALTDSNPLAAAQTIGLCSTTMSGSGEGVISVDWVHANGNPAAPSSQVGILPSFGALQPASGSRLLVLSSGRARVPGQPDACEGIGCAGSGPGTAPPGFPQSVPSCPVGSNIFDDVGLQLTLRAPADAQGFSFDFSFYTFEYPDYVCSEFNDQFIVLMTPSPQGTINGNIAFDSATNPVSVNIADFNVCDPSTSGTTGAPCSLGTSELVGTGFDTWGVKLAGATGWLTTTAPVQPGQEFTLRFAIWDTGDNAYDSTVVIDNFRWLTTDPGGTQTIPKM